MRSATSSAARVPRRRSWRSTTVANPGRTSFDTFITLERTDEPGVVYANGGATTVWVDFPRQKAVPLPDWLRALLG
jgi:acyl-CoA thioester hydrolase